MVQVLVHMHDKYFSGIGNCWLLSPVATTVVFILTQPGQVYDK